MSKPTRWAAALMIAATLVGLARLGCATSTASRADVVSCPGYSQTWLGALQFKGLTIAAQLP
jgi:hypothetical protein